MKLRKLKLLNFRNCSKLNIDFSDNINILIGDNAQGKTNILESIVILALTKSHRVGFNPNIIMFNKKKAQIRGDVRKNNITSKLEVTITDEGKNFNVNFTEIKRISDYISNLNVIVFTPDDLEIVKGSPNVRRNLLNIQLSQISKVYLNTYNEYNKLLKTRNEYLKILFSNNIADKAYLDIITDKLIEKAVIIYRKRYEYIEFINKNINKYYESIADCSNLKVVYIPNIDFTCCDEENIRLEMKSIFKKNYNRELMYGMTMFGPHRDDFSFIINDNDIKYYGSQGQQKSAILSFKLAEIPIFYEWSGTKPVLLLDDIFSELDVKKRNKLLKFIRNENIQTIMTTTDIRNINKKYLDNAYIYEIKNGNIERK